MMKVINISGDDAAPGIVMYATIISLFSEKQAGVKKIVCGHWDEPHLVEPLTLKELITALGDLIIVNKKRANIL